MLLPINVSTKLVVALAFAWLLTGCLRTTPDTEIRKLVSEGYTLRWTEQRGEYWDEFVAKKGKRTRKVVVNRKKVRRNPRMNEGDPNTVELLDSGRLEVTKLAE